MPTGYTADIAEGVTFERFVWNCARAFGALVLMRDEPTGAPIPQRFEPSPYYAQALAAAEAEWVKVGAMKIEDAGAACEAEHDEAMENYRKRCAAKLALRGKYNDMLARVNEWQAPTAEHQGLKDFMAQQITESISWDCDTPSMPVKMSPGDWLVGRLEYAKRSVDYARKSHQEEIKRVDGRNAWLEALRKSVPIPVELLPAA